MVGTFSVCIIVSHPHTRLVTHSFILLFTKFIHIFTFAAFSHHQSNTLLLLSTSKDVRIINTTKINNKIQKPTILIPNLNDGVAIDYHYASKKLCWTDHMRESIQCIGFDGVEVKNSVSLTNRLSPVFTNNQLPW